MQYCTRMYLFDAGCSFRRLSVSFTRWNSSAWIVNICSWTTGFDSRQRQIVLSSSLSPYWVRGPNSQRKSARSTKLITCLNLMPRIQMSCWRNIPIPRTYLYLWCGDYKRRDTHLFKLQNKFHYLFYIRNDWHIPTELLIKYNSFTLQQVKYFLLIICWVDESWRLTIYSSVI
jgi:hypothetical protein